MASEKDSASAMAPIALHQFTPAQTPKFKPIIESATALDGNNLPEFNVDKHIAFDEYPKTITMKEIGLANDTGVSPFAVSQPFRLFSQEAVQAMRSEIFNPEVAEKCGFHSNIAASQLRGYSPKYAPFTYDAWTNPKVLEIVSKIAGIDLIPQMNYEIAHINFSVKSDAQTNDERVAIEQQKGSGRPWEDDHPVVGWHNDSPPFVCVLMLSDCTDMVGGETALRTATGEVIKVRGPEMGCAVVLQGRHITHQALRAIGTKERITAVTSFRPRSPFVRDDSVLTTVRPVSNLSELYGDFGEYRLEILEAQIRAQLKTMREQRRAGKKFDTAGFKAFLTAQIVFAQTTNEEVILDEEVKAGHIDEKEYCCRH